MFFVCLWYRLGWHYEPQHGIWDYFYNGTLVDLIWQKCFSKVSHTVGLQIDILKHKLLDLGILEFGQHCQFGILKKLIVDKDSEINSVQHYNGLILTIQNEFGLCDSRPGIFLLDFKVPKDVKEYILSQVTAYPPNVSVVYGCVGSEQEIVELSKELEKQGDKTICPLVILKSTPSKPATCMLLIASADFKDRVSQAASSITLDDLSFCLTEVKNGIQNGIQSSGMQNHMIGSNQQLFTKGRNPTPTLSFIAPVPPLTVPYSLYIM